MRDDTRVSSTQSQVSASPEGGPDAAALWRAFESQLRGYAARRVKKTELDDVVQETFLRIHRALGSGTEVRDLRGWVFQVLRSAIADHHRKRARSREDVAGDGIDDAPAGEGAEGANENERVGGWLPFFIEALPPTPGGPEAGSADRAAVQEALTSASRRAAAALQV